MKKANKILSGLSILLIIIIAITILETGNINKIGIQDNAVKALELVDAKYNLKEVVMETPKSAIARIEVFDGKTLEELSTQLNKSLGSDVLSGYGEYIAAKSISYGMDPYLVTAIMLHETGCGSRCSNLARSCNNFGGQKGSPGCGGGSYKSFNSIQEGLNGMIDNLYYNYYAKGLNNVYSIGKKYAEGNTWPTNITNYMNKIKNK